MRAVTESGGAFVAVPDEEILESITVMARKAGVFGEPAGVACVAGVKRAVTSGIIGRNESVALIMTGNGLKDIQSAIRAAGRAIAVRPEMDEIRNRVAYGRRRMMPESAREQERGKHTMARIPFGPSYDEMLDPGLIDNKCSRQGACCIARERTRPD